MALTYGFYNSINNDRKYNSTQFSSLFDGLIEDGVYLSVGDAFIVTQNATPDMNIVVGSGRAWFDHTWSYNDAAVTLTVSTADIVHPRIDVVVLEVNRSESVRANSLKIIKGSPSSTPVAPTLQHTADIDQYPLAELYVGANVTQILDANITIKVGSVDCPFVAGVLSSFDVTSLLAGWSSYFSNTFLPNLTTYFNNTFLPALQTDFNNLIGTFETAFQDLVDLKEAEFGGLVTGWNDDFDAFIAARQADFDAWLSTQTVKEVLTANRIYYVRTDGNDSNTGLTNSSGGAWLTIQHAIDVVTRTIDLRQYNVTIYASRPTPVGYLSKFVLAPYTSNGGYISIVGVDGTYIPQVFGGSYVNDILVTGVNAGYWVLNNLYLSYAYKHIYTKGNTRLDLIDISYERASSSGYHIHATEGSIINILTIEKITEYSGSHILVEKNSQVLYGPASTIEFDYFGTMNFPLGFIQVLLNSLVSIPDTTISLGSTNPTGIRYKVIGNSTIYTNGKSATYLPGSIAGEATNGGIYF